MLVRTEAARERAHGSCLRLVGRDVEPFDGGELVVEPLQLRGDPRLLTGPLGVGGGEPSPASPLPARTERARRAARSSAPTTWPVVVTVIGSFLRGADALR